MESSWLDSGETRGERSGEGADMPHQPVSVQDAGGRAGAEFASPEPEPADETPDDDDPPEAWVAYLKGTYQGAHVVRRSPTGWETLYTLETPQDVAEWTREDTERVYGGGRYQLCFLDENKRYIRRISWRAAGEPRHPDGAPDDEPEESRLDRLERLVEELASSKSGNRSPEWLEAAVSIASTMTSAQTPLLTALIERQQEGPGMADMLEVLREGMELGQSAGGYGSVLDRTLPPILQAIQSRGDGLPSHPQPPMRHNPPGPTPAPERSDGTPTPAWVRVIHPYVAQLAQLGSFHGSVEHWAPVILSRAPDSHLEILAPHIERGEEWVDDLCSWYEELIDVRPWLAELVAEMGDVLDEQYFPDADETSDAVPDR